MTESSFLQSRIFWLNGAFSYLFQLKLQSIVHNDIKWKFKNINCYFANYYHIENHRVVNKKPISTITFVF